MDRRVHPVFPSNNSRGHTFNVPHGGGAQASSAAEAEEEGDSWLPAWLYASPAASCAGSRSEDKRRCCTPVHLAAPMQMEPASSSFGCLPGVRGASKQAEQEPAVEDSEESPQRRMARRKRVVLFTIVLVWLASGACVFSSMRLGPIRIIYLMVQIITTVGYGDFVPASQTEKLACTFIVISSTLLISNVIMAGVAEYVDKGADELSNDMDIMTHNISAFKEAEERRALIDDDLQTQELIEPNGFAVKQQEERWKRTQADLSVSVAAFIVCLLTGVVFFKLVDACNPYDCEKYGGRVHTWVDAFYMCVMTMTTVGFGDIVPQSKVGRIFASVWMMIAVAVTVRLLGSVSNIIDQVLRADVRSEMTQQLFHESDENGDGQLDEMEFLKLQLVQNGLASKYQVEAIRSQFALIAGSDHRISMDEYAAYFLPARK